MMGVGKSTLGKKIAKKLKYNFIDVDKIIEIKEGMSINLIFKNKGENYFRKMEREITLLELKKNNNVVSLGGGAFLDNRIRRNVKKLTVSFWLDVSINKLMKRLKKNKQRPLLYGKNVNEEVKKPKDSPYIMIFKILGIAFLVAFLVILFWKYDYLK